MDNLVSILKMPALNHDVKNKMLRYIQDWATAFEGKPSLSYVGEVYRSLQRDGKLVSSLPACVVSTPLSQVSTSLPVIPH